MVGTEEKPGHEKNSELKRDFKHWEKIKDCVDQCIDIMMNYRQSGHPGGSRSKVHALLTTMLSGVMKWDIRNPEKRFSDRFVLGAGHTIPLVYASLAVLKEVMRYKYRQTRDEKYAFVHSDSKILYYEDLAGFRRRGGLSGHAEMGGKTHFLKFNTGPTGVRVFMIEGEGGLTDGATHETANSAWGMALDNLHFLVDWNNYGIDDHKASDVLFGTAADWFAPHGWNVFGAENGSDWEQLSEALWEMVTADNPGRVPSVTWFRTRKGRDYLKYGPMRLYSQMVQDCFGQKEKNPQAPVCPG